MTEQSIERKFDPKVFLSHVTTLPGVYQMRDKTGKLVYVGKAKNLRKRLSSYFRNTGLSTKTQALMNVVVDIDTTATQTEIEALILENNLIKQYHPKFNILLRDDKSYPYLHLSAHEFPKLSLHRGARRQGEYFGPFPNVQAARYSMDVLQKVFRVRQCEDSYFANRSRPCLQYQIERCYAPCVGLMDSQVYAHTVDSTRAFLNGESSHLLDRLSDKMQAASDHQQYEQAAMLRDQLRQLRKIVEKQNVVSGDADVDVIAIACAYGVACVRVMFYRNGHNISSQSFYPKLPEMRPEGEILQAFMGQFYLQRPAPSQILISHELPDMEAVSGLLSTQAKHRVMLTVHPKEVRRKWLMLAEENAKISLNMQLANKLSMQQRFQNLADAFGWEDVPKRLECADISHMQGEYTVASCVVFDQRGAVKSDYRRYKIKDITGGDDYAAMRQMLKRRFERLKQGEGIAPDVFFVDGGKGQLRQAIEVLDELAIKSVRLIGVAKGQGRKAGLEQFWMPNEPQPKILPTDSPAMQLIVQIRDEAHRFAIAGHRAGRDKKVKRSILESISGVGAKRRQALIKHFGGLAMIEQASIESLGQVPGISATLAKNIYANLHEEG